MTERRSSRRTESGRTPDVIEVQHTDEKGIPRVTLLPKGETDAAMGIPVSLDLSPLFGHMPDAFQRDLISALHAQGLVKAADYFKPGASERFRRALFTVIAHDFLDVQALAQQEITHV